MERKSRDEKESLFGSKDKTKLKLLFQGNANTSTHSNKKTNTESPFSKMYEQHKKKDTTVRQQPGLVQHYHQYNVVNKNYSLFGNSKNSYGPPNDDSKKKNGQSKCSGKSCTACMRGMCCLF